MAPAAHADGGDADYVERLAMYAIHGDPTSIGWGHRICTRISTGASPLTEARELRTSSPQMTEQQADGEVDAALMTYCPTAIALGADLIPTT